MAKELCVKHGLLSPIYNSSQRQGCWFCPNQRYSQLLVLRKEYPQLWNELKALGAMDNIVGDKFKDNLTIEQVEDKLNQIEFSRDHKNMVWKK